MRIEFMAIGNELLNGKTADSLGFWLSRELAKNSYQLSASHIYPDNSELLIEKIRFHLSKCDILILSGGLGPTQDDKTKDCLQRAFNKELVFNEQANQIIKNNQKRFGRENIDTQKLYSQIPQDFIAFANSKGMAPGLGYFHEQNRKLILAAPGVPREFHNMMQNEFIPFIKQKFPQEKRYRKAVNARTKLIPEEQIFTQLCPTLWKDLSQYGEVFSLPHVMNVDIGVYLEEDAQDLIDEKEKKIIKLITSSPLKEHIWQIGQIPLEEYIVQKATTKKITFSFAESCTGGLCASRITDISGSSAVFYGSVVSYSNEVKNKTIDVQNETMIASGAVSIETAKEMAVGVMEEIEADIAISLTGIAGPGGGSQEKPVGTVCIGSCNTGGNSWAKKYQLSGDRQQLKYRFSQLGLFRLLEEIENW